MSQPRFECALRVAVHRRPDGWPWERPAHPLPSFSGRTESPAGEGHHKKLSLPVIAYVFILLLSRNFTKILSSDVSSW